MAKKKKGRAEARPHRNDRAAVYWYDNDFDENAWNDGALDMNKVLELVPWVRSEPRA